MTSRPRTRVYLTVDVECAEERLRGGRVLPALDYDLRVWGRFRNQPRPLGVPLILAELGRYGQRATFFVEVFSSCHFGEHHLRELCAELGQAGQDIQLHTHPVQRYAEWYSLGQPAPPDEMAAYGLEQQAALLREGLGILERCGVSRNRLLGFRAGGYAANNLTWQAMSAVGLRVSSNLNLSYLDRTCRIRWARPENSLFATDVPQVWELPISNQTQGRGRLRHLQLTALCFGEMKHYLEQAIRLRIPEVTIVTHSFEYFFVDSVEARRGRPNWCNIRRLRRLLAFLHQRSAEFELDTVGALGARLEGHWPGGILSGPPAAIPRGRTALELARHVEQLAKRVQARAGRGWSLLRG